MIEEQYLNSEKVNEVRQRNRSLRPSSRSSAGKREKMTKEKNTVGSRIRP